MATDDRGVDRCATATDVGVVFVVADGRVEDMVLAVICGCAGGADDATEEVR